MNIKDLIATVFSSYGFDVAGGTTGDRYILATKGTVNLAIGFRFDGEIVGKKELLGFLGLSTNDDAHRHIFIAMGGLDTEAADVAKQGDIEVWEAERFQREVGRAIISEFSGDREPAAAMTSPADTAEGVHAGGHTSFESLLTGTGPAERPVGPGIGYLGEPGTMASPAGGNAGEGGPTSIPEGMDTSIMRIHLSRADAQDLARKIEGYRYDLQLIPYYIFDYTCELTIEGQGDVQHNNGTLGINALTLRHEQWPTSYETIDTLDLPHTRLESRYGFGDARNTVDSAVISLNTKVVETVEEKESATVIERRKVRPKEDALEIASRGVVYLPVWCIEGRNGVMIIDAASGNILKEETFKSRETVIL